MILYATTCDDSPGLWAVDTETTLFTPKQPFGKTTIAPQSVPDLVVGQIAGGDQGRCMVLDKDEFVERLDGLLRNGDHLVFHNVAFDFEVIVKAAPHLFEPLCRAVDEGRVHDTKLLEQLVRIADGTDKEALHANLRLKDLAFAYAGRRLDKDSDARVTFGDYANDVTKIPSRMLEYAAEDAIATLEVYRALETRAKRLADVECRYPAHEYARSKWGLLDEVNQVRGDIALSWLQRFPLRVDLELAKKHAERLREEGRRIEDCLVEFGFARRGPRSGKFSQSFKALREALEQWAEARDITPEFSDTGLVSLKYEFWSRYIPKPDARLLADPSSASNTTERLSVWMRFMRLNKLLTTYIDVYASSPEHYPNYYTIGARTTRTSSSKPNAQNIPKRRDGIRALFVPRKGNVFVECDFVSAELVTLSQVYQLMFGGSALGDAINQGKDPHAVTAERIFGNKWREEDEKGRGTLRQAAKAVNFGLPGGMGARAFSDFARGYGIFLDLDDARGLRQKALAADPELREYLSEDRSDADVLELAASNLGVTVDRVVTASSAWQGEAELGRYNESLAARSVRAWARGDDSACALEEWEDDPVRGSLFDSETRTLTGLVRGRARYTERHNTPFQAPIADAAKISAWNLFKAWRPDCGWEPAAFVHDSFLLDVEPAKLEEAKETLERAMLEGIHEVCPDIAGRVETEVLGERWGQLKDGLGKVI